MGLGNFSNDNGEERSGTSKSGGSRKYVKIEGEEFIQFLESLPVEFEEVSDRRSGERVYQTTGAPIGVDHVRVRVYSTIQKGAEKGRDKGDDAIRTVLYDTRGDAIVGGRKKTLRIETWESNLRPKIMELVDEAVEYLTECHVCNKGWLRQKEGEYGEFLGCSHYPDCEFMCFEYEDGKYVARTSKDGEAGFGSSLDEARENLWDELDPHV